MVQYWVAITTKNKSNKFTFEDESRARSGIYAIVADKTQNSSIRALPGNR